MYAVVLEKSFRGVCFASESLDGHTRPVRIERDDVDDPSLCTRPLECDGLGAGPLRGATGGAGGELDVLQPHLPGLPPGPELYLCAGLGRHVFLRGVKLQCLPWASDTREQGLERLEVDW